MDGFTMYFVEELRACDLTPSEQDDWPIPKEQLGKLATWQSRLKADSCGTKTKGTG